MGRLRGDQHVPPGRYQVITRVTRFPDAVTRVDLAAASEATADLVLRLAGVREEVTVTASNADESTVNAIRTTEVAAGEVRVLPAFRTRVDGRNAAVPTARMRRRWVRAAL